jgi:outer membrane protein insertion porin family
MKLKTLPLLLLAIYAPLGLADSGWVVKNIRVEGIERIEPGTVFNYLPVHVGDELTPERAGQAVRALYATGFFKDVQLRDEQGTLVIMVQERPAIGKLTINGAHEIKKEDLLKGLKESGIAEARIYDPGAVERAVTDLKRAYLSHALYGVDITVTAAPMPRNRVDLTFNITEGKPAKIERINIIGNHVFPTNVLLKQFTLRTPGLFTRFTKNDQYSKEKLEADLERLRSYYLDRGYLDFRITSTQVEISPDKTGVDIAINVTEGQKYTVSDIRFSGNLIVPEAELTKLLTFHKGEIFSRQALTESIQKIGDRLGTEGYAFANVQAQPQVDPQNHTVAFNMLIDPGHRVYIRRINISGNVKTKDAVIRRELRQLESGWYDTASIKRSKERLNRLGYFDDVKIDAVPVPGSSDQVDLDVKVNERSTGTIQAGMGYSTQDKLFLTAGVSQSNLFGTGNQGSFQVNTGKVNQVYSLSYTNPYYTPDGISRGFDVYKRRLDTSYWSVAPYVSDTLGAGIRYGIPISEKNGLSVGAAVEKTTIEVFDNSPDRYKNFVKDYGNTNHVLMADLGWSNDTRDSLLYPTKGHLNSIYSEIGLPGGLTYYKLNYQGQVYKPVSSNTTLMLNTFLGYGHGYGGKDLPFYKNFYAGGPNSIRGFGYGTIGHKDSPDLVSLGGNRMIVGNAEYFFPVPGLSDNKNLRLSVFMDAGSVWQEGEKISPSDIRVSAGVGLSWYSPLGPLKFSLARPLRKQAEDQLEPFQFTIGTAF